MAGTYTVSINDGAGCTYSQSVTLTDPSSLEAMVNLTSPISCNGASDGALTLSISGGTASYAYTWSTGSTSLSISGLSAGDYVVNAADANGCQANITYTLSEPGLFAVNAVSVTDASCYGVANGSIDMGVTGGTAQQAKTYLLSLLVRIL